MRAALLLMLFLSCAREPELQVFAAASLADALTAAGKAYGGNVAFNFGASSTLARQIDAGAPADLFLSADERQMNWLEERGRIVATSRVSILSNRLAIVGDLRTARTIAIADPAAVPAGVYARQYLESIGMWDSVAPRVVPTDNVRAALHAVTSGNADAAIVYGTDVKGPATIVEHGPPISYPAAVVRDARNAGEAERFLRWLQSPPAQDIFRTYGFPPGGKR